MRRVVIGTADMCRDLVGKGFRVRPAMITLTYREGAEWGPRHVAEYITRVRNWLGRRGIGLGYQWVLELTKRGVPHYHVLVWLPHNVKLPKPDSSGQWPHGSSNIGWARRAVGYLVKYATKGHGEQELPKGARVFGVGAPLKEIRARRHRMGLPMWLGEHVEEGDTWRRAPFIGWFSRDSGEIRRSPFTMRVFRENGRFIVVCREVNHAF